MSQYPYGDKLGERVGDNVLSATGDMVGNIVGASVDSMVLECGIHVMTLIRKMSTVQTHNDLH